MFKYIILAFTLLLEAPSIVTGQMSPSYLTVDKEIVRHSAKAENNSTELYYINLKYNTAKGSVAADTYATTAKGGHASGLAQRTYASDRVVNETSGVGNGGSSYSIVLASHPVRPGATTIVMGADSFTDAGTDSAATSATLVGTVSGSSGTITYATGVVTLTTGTTHSSAVTIYSSYRYNAELYPAGIGGIDLEIASQNVDAQIFPLKLNYSVFAAINMQKLHGMILADEGMKFCTQEIRFAIDQVVLEAAMSTSLGTGAATTVGDFSTTVGANQEWVFKLLDFKKYLSKASANIFAKTLRATGNTIVGGVNIFSLIEQIPEFKSALAAGAKPPSGPYVAGTLNGRTIINNPFYSADEYCALFRGDNWMYAGLAYCPYVPLYSTEPVTLNDFTTQRGFMSMAAIQVINEGMFCRGTISSY